MDMICGCDVDFHHLAEVVVVRFLHHKVTLPTLPPHLHTFCSPHLRGGGYPPPPCLLPPPWRWSTYIKWFGILLHEILVSSCIFIYSVIYLSQYGTHRYLFYTLDYNPMLVYFFGQIVPAFSWLLCPFLSCFSRLCLCRFTPPWLTYREISIHRVEDSY